MTQWISVKQKLPVERKPEYEGESATSAWVLVWVVINGRKFSNGWYRGRYVYASRLGWQVEGYAGYCNGGKDNFEVTHWAFVNAPEEKQ